MIKAEIFSLTHQTISEQAHEILAQGELAVSWEQWCMLRYGGVRSK